MPRPHNPVTWMVSLFAAIPLVIAGYIFLPFIVAPFNQLVGFVAEHVYKSVGSFLITIACIMGFLLFADPVLWAVWTWNFAKRKTRQWLHPTLPEVKEIAPPEEML